MTRVRWTFIHRCRYCGNNGTHHADTPCPYAKGFREGFNAGFEDAFRVADQKAADQLIQEIDQGSQGG